MGDRAHARELLESGLTAYTELGMEHQAVKVHRTSGARLSLAVTLTVVSPTGQQDI